MWSPSKLFLAVACLAVGSRAATVSTAPVVLYPNSTRLHKHGRWDLNNGTWWPGTGFKFVASGLTNFTLHLGQYTNWPAISVAVSFDYGEFSTVNVSTGANVISVPALTPNNNRVVRLNVEASIGTRMQLEKIELNAGADVKHYKPSPLRFQFIGDSLSAGWLNPRGVNDAWTFLTAQKFKAEHNIIAQSGACLTDRECWGNVHGMSYQYFQTEDTSYIWAADHNYTTPWDFQRDLTPTHIVIVIGANDNSFSISGTDFASQLSSFITHLRTLYPQQPVFVFTPWGWSDGTSQFWPYYDGVYASVVNAKVAAGDQNIFVVNTTGWLQTNGVYPNDGHPNPVGHQQILEKFTAWLQAWGLQPRTSWPS
ncbi:GDSL-like lipase acylhydrolase domain containing protein [Ceratobasidium theobromae]|uniref:GDSL-like lipase acylhydrolase domain containing protein n=1 Tax=Ceratobasidium theobromae TaxID=1582974 RepID=A0A5N5QBU0_9AGAM|nr:GDSL-like lipase acylhydrolase domain containing protein [Ceratobasidium theobromae]